MVGGGREHKEKDGRGVRSMHVEMRVGRGWGKGGERVERGWREGGERVGRGRGEGGERVGRGWGVTSALSKNSLS